MGNFNCQEGKHACESVRGEILGVEFSESGTTHNGVSMQNGAHARAFMCALYNNLSIRYTNNFYKISINKNF